MQGLVPSIFLCTDPAWRPQILVMPESGPPDT